MYLLNSCADDRTLLFHACLKVMSRWEVQKLINVGPTRDTTERQLISARLISACSSLFSLAEYLNQSKSVGFFPAEQNTNLLLFFLCVCFGPDTDTVTTDGFLSFGGMPQRC